VSDTLVAIDGSMRSITAPSRYRTEDYQVIKQPSTCASTRGWPKLRPFSQEDCVFLLPGNVNGKIKLPPLMVFG
jgi:hypothetical protein